MNRICPECGKENELLTSVSTQIEFGRNYTYEVQVGHCQKCLKLGLWSSLISGDYDNFHLWKQFAERCGYDPKLLEFKPTYLKIISVKNRIYKNNEYVDEYIDIGFRMNGTDFLGTVYIYKGYIDGMGLLEMKSGNKRYTNDGGLHPTNSKLLKLVEKQLISKLKRRIDPYVMGNSWRHRNS
jgi:hypothetical protein